MRQILIDVLLLGLLPIIAYAVYDLYRIFRHKKKSPGTPYALNLKLYNTIAIYLAICGTTFLYLRLT